MTWSGAAWRALSIFIYFVVASVCLPDFIISLDAVAGASAWLRDGLVTLVWVAALFGGLLVLRRMQQRGTI